MADDLPEVTRLIEKWRKEAATYSKQVEGARQKNSNANDDMHMPFRNTEGHMAQLRICAHELEGALGLRKPISAIRTLKPIQNPENPTA